MAGKTRVEAEIHIEATDDASKTIDRLESRIDGMEADEARITIAANTDRLEKQLDSARKKLATLDGDEATVQARLVGSLESDLDDARRLFESLDGKSGTVKIDADTSGAKQGLGDIEEMLGQLDIGVGGIGSKLGGLASPGGAIVAIGAGLLVAADAAADIAIEADNLAALTGDSVEQASRLNAVWKSTGAESKDLQDVLLQMNGVLATNADLAAELGINLSDGATVGQRFEQVAAALDKIPDAAKRSQIASQVFGEEGVRQYTAMRQAVGDLSEALDDVPEGQVMSAEDVERARQAKAEMKELSTEMQAFATAVGSAVVPILADLVGAFNDTFDAAEKVGRGIRGFFDADAAKNFKIADEFEAAEAAAASFDRELLKGATSFEEVLAIVLEYTDSQHAANVVALEWAETHRDAGDEVVDSFTASKNAADRYVGDLIAKGRKVRGELGEQSTAVDGLTRKYELLHAEISDESSLIRLGQGFDDLAAQTVDAYGAMASGAEDAKRKQEDLRLAQLAQKDAVLDYIETLGDVPESTTTAILAAIDEGDYAEADRRLKELARDREATVRVGVRITYSGGGGVGGGQIVIRPDDLVGTSAELSATGMQAAAMTGAGFTQVNVNLPRTASGQEVAGAVDKWARING